MKLARLRYEPAALIDFYQDSLEQLGAVCERTWHDRLHLIAEGAAARAWNEDGALHEVELHFPPSGDTAPRNAATEVFPGSPLTFRLAEALRPAPLPLERAILAPGTSGPPATEVAEKRWHAQFPQSTRWRLVTPFQAAHSFSLLALVRCEIQAIDQHWSLHRIALTLPDGVPDEDLATKFAFAQIDPAPATGVTWPSLAIDSLRRMLGAAVESELSAELAGVRARQENCLRRELDRIDDYFQNYEAELAARGKRADNQSKVRAADRLAAAKIEHTRRREDQVKRHEIRIIPHVDAVLLVAEPAWRTRLAFYEHNEERHLEALFNPRSRCWQLL